MTHRVPLNPSFFDRPIDTWDILEYLNEHDPKLPSYNHQLTLDKWSKALAAITTDRKCSLDQRKRAQLLLDQFKNPVRDHFFSSSILLVLKILLSHSTYQCWDTDELIAHLAFKLLACEANTGTTGPQMT